MTNAWFGLRTPLKNRIPSTWGGWRNGSGASSRRSNRSHVQRITLRRAGWIAGFDLRHRCVAFWRALYQRWRDFRSILRQLPLLAGVSNVRFFERAPENGRWPGASQRRHRYQDYRYDAGDATRSI